MPVKLICDRCGTWEMYDYRELPTPWIINGEEILLCVVCKEAYPEGIKQAEKAYSDTLESWLKEGKK